jgi:YbbR domain-containing protein
VEVVGLGEGLTADVRPQLVTVTLEGPSSTIAELVERRPSAIVDLTDLTPGLHPLALELDATPGVIVMLVPDEVTVVITEEGQEEEEE